MLEADGRRVHERAGGGDVDPVVGCAAGGAVFGRAVFHRAHGIGDRRGAVVGERQGDRGAAIRGDGGGEVGDAGDEVGPGQDEIHAAAGRGHGDNARADGRVAIEAGGEFVRAVHEQEAVGAAGIGERAGGGGARGGDPGPGERRAVEGTHGAGDGGLGVNGERDRRDAGAGLAIHGGEP